MGSAGEPVATGDIVVELSFPEGFMSMVWREMKAQRPRGRRPMFNEARGFGEETNGRCAT